MTKSLIKDALILTGFSVAACLMFVNRYEIYPMVGIDIKAPTSETGEKISFLESLSFSKKVDDPTLETQEISVKPNVPTGSVVTIQKNLSDGQFWTDARVNSGVIHFLVDTGASTIALTLDDAKKAGIRERDLAYTIPISTAGGTNMAARVTLDTVSVGAITLRNIDALVVPKGLSVSLLGMTYLGELQKVEASPTMLILRF